MNTLYNTLYDSPIGLLQISCNDTAVVRVCEIAQKIESYDNHPLLQKTISELSEYFLGKRTSFDIPIELNGTDFQKRVWQELMKIPFGETKTYGEISRLIGKPNASRAVGGACNKNKLLIFVPCHRVVGANGKLVGFAIGLGVKEQLLDLEQKRN